MKNRLKRYLLLFNGALTLVLAAWRATHTRHLLRELRTDFIFDYVSPAECAMHAINALVSLLCAAAFNQAFQIGIEYSLPLFGIYLALVGVLWFCVGWLIQDYPQMLLESPSRAIAPRLVGYVVAAVLVLRGMAMLRGPRIIYIPLGSIVWGAVLIFLFARHPVRRG